jgi:multidrug efflux pump subunit AcrA (membrane-fusion protein)
MATPMGWGLFMRIRLVSLLLLLTTGGAASTLKRRQQLAESKIVSQQDLDERIADLAGKQAAVKSNHANVDRLEALAGYKRVLGPFDGVVTARETDVGALINAGSSSAPAMIVVSDTTKLRVYVNVPPIFCALYQNRDKSRDLRSGVLRP